MKTNNTQQDNLTTYQTDLGTLDMFNEPHKGETRKQYIKRQTNNGRKLLNYYARTLSRILQEAKPDKWTRDKANRAAELVTKNMDPFEFAELRLPCFITNNDTCNNSKTDAAHMEDMARAYLVDAGELRKPYVDCCIPTMNKWEKIKEQIKQEQEATTEEEKEEQQARCYFDWSGGYYNEADFFASLI